MDYELSKGGVLVPAAESSLGLGGHYHGQIIRAGEIIDEFDCPNLCVDEGLNSLLNIQFDGATQITTWYMGLFEGNYTPVAGDVGTTIAASATETIALTNTVRPTWTPAAAAAKAITNAASRATFTFNAAKTIYGGFLISNNTLNGSTGKLFAASRFTSAKLVDVNDQILLTYAFAGASA